mgnify:CR=1 FL=1
MSLDELSEKRLATCHEDLQRLVREVARHMRIRVTAGYRSPEEQERLWRLGRSKARPGQSKHNRLPSEAVDIVPLPVDWDDIARWHYFGGFVMGVAAVLGIQVRWGGDWNRNDDPGDERFFDGPHFELET